MSTETIITADTVQATATAAGDVVLAATDDTATVAETVLEATEGASDLTTKLLIGAGVLVGVGLGYLGYRGVKNMIIARAEKPTAAADPVQRPEKPEDEPVQPANVRPVNPDPEAPAQAQA